MNAQGFEIYVQTGIVLQVNESPKINIALHMGTVNEQVVVNADAAMVQSDTPSVSQVIDQARITELPLNGRVPTQLVKHRYDGGQIYLGAYAHDVYQMSKRLTVQLGVRWEPNFWGNERDGRMQHFDLAAFNAGRHSDVYPNAPAGLLFPEDHGVGSTFAENHPWKFEPWAGTAWDPTGSGRQHRSRRLRPLL